jgi:hypothetical protein
MRTFLTVALAGMFALGIIGIALAQENAPQSQRPNQGRPVIHGPRSIDQELDHLTKDLELTENSGNRSNPCFRSTTTGFRRFSTRIQASHVKTLARRSTRSATKRTMKLKRC